MLSQSQSDCQNVVVCWVGSEENKSNNNPATPTTPRVASLGYKFQNNSPHSEPIETLLFVCGSLCCLCFPLPSLFLLIFLHFSLCSDLVDKFIILLPAQNSDHPTMGRYKGGNSFRVEIFPMTTHSSE